MTLNSAKMPSREPVAGRITLGEEGVLTKLRRKSISKHLDAASPKRGAWTKGNNV
jgi:hypothetical protein